MIKIECKRAFFNVRFLMVVLIGAVFAVLQFLAVALPFSQQLAEIVEWGKRMTSVEGLYGLWLGGNTMTTYTVLFFFVVPLLAVLPYGDSYWADRHFGYEKQIITRTDRKKYLVAKLVATFTSAGTVVVAPLVFSLMITAAVLPATLPQKVTSQYSLGPLNLLYQLFFDTPLAYIAIWLALIFVFAGLIACTALTLGHFCTHRFTVVAVPLVLYFIVDALLGIAGYIDYSPVSFLRPGIGAVSGLVIVAQMALLCLLGPGLFLAKGVRGDVF